MRSLVGFIITDPDAPLPQESHLILNNQQMTGRVTSCHYSPTLNKALGLAYVPPECAAVGSDIIIKSTGGVLVHASVVELPFYDPKTSRQEL